LNKQEATELQKKISDQSIGLKESNIALVFPTAGDPSSHGYQLYINSDNLKLEMPKIEAIAQTNNLAVEIRKDVIVVFRPCFAGHSNQNDDLI
jgi:hypothetical protein